MKLRVAAILGACALWAIATPRSEAASCRAHSGAATAALVELYTSEGCSSCPPADRALSHLGEVLGPGAQGFGLALHVDYWDSLGWRDPWAQELFSERQRWLVHANHHSIVYTPHFFVSGSELSPGLDELRAQVRAVNSRPALAQIELSAQLLTAGKFALDATAQASSGVAEPALYIAVAQSGLVSNVLRGENAGRVLAHDHLVRTWIGPIAFVDGQVRVQREFSVPAAPMGTGWELTAFVQEQQSGRIVQALGLQACTP